MDLASGGLMTTYNADQGGDLSPDEVEFGRAVEEYQRLRRRRYPQFSEIREPGIPQGSGEDALAQGSRLLPRPSEESQQSFA
jgi:hypothetical protein